MCFRQGGFNRVACHQIDVGFRTQLFAHAANNGLRVGRFLERYRHFVGGDFGITDDEFLFLGFAADVACDAFQGFLLGCIHVHLHGEMHAAAQIQTQEHRASANLAHPHRGIRNQIQGDDVAFTQGFINHVAGFDLLFFRIEADFQAAAVEKLTVGFDVGLC